jgi:UMF1 family MFS transporter
MIQFPQLFGIEEGSTLPARIGFLLVGVWWLGFAQLTFRRMPPDKEGSLDFRYVKKGIEEVRIVFREVLKNKNVFRFLMSFLFFNAGVQTVIYVATIFAKLELNFETAELIQVVLLLQLVASGGAILFAYVSKFLGNKLTLLIQIVIWICICIAAYYTTGKEFFYVVSAFVGLVLGGIQSLARSAYSKMIDDNKDTLTSYFSFFDVLSKVAIVSGAFIFAVVDQITGNMRYSVLSLAVLFLIGFIFMLTVDKESMMEKA